MTPVTRYLLVSRVERETNNDLKSSLAGSDWQSGLYNGMKAPESYAITRPLIMALSIWSLLLVNILCSLGAMFAFKESDLQSARRFPSQRKYPESVK